MNATTTGKTMTERPEYPSAVYAAAGVGDLAYEQLRKLPEYAERLRAEAGKLRERAPELRAQATHKAEALRTKAGGQLKALRADARSEADRLRARATELGSQATEKAGELTSRIDMEKLRESLTNASSNVTEQAGKLYEELVARGERVVRPEVAVAVKESVSDIDAESVEATVEATVETQAKVAAQQDVAETVAQAAPVIEEAVGEPKTVKPAARRKPRAKPAG